MGSEMCIRDRHSGIVESADANRIVVKCMNSRNVVTGVDIYNLEKYERSNNDTILHQNHWSRRVTVFLRATSLPTVRQ